MGASEGLLDFSLIVPELFGLDDCNEIMHKVSVVMTLTLSRPHAFRTYIR